MVWNHMPKSGNNPKLCDTGWYSIFASFSLEAMGFLSYFVEISHEPLVKHDAALYVYR
jgi:hypothetical protein